MQTEAVLGLKFGHFIGILSSIHPSSEPTEALLGTTGTNPATVEERWGTL